MLVCLLHTLCAVWCAWRARHLRGARCVAGRIGGGRASETVPLGAARCPVVRARCPVARVLNTNRCALCGSYARCVPCYVCTDRAILRFTAKCAIPCTMRANVTPCKAYAGFCVCTVRTVRCVCTLRAMLCMHGSCQCTLLGTCSLLGTPRLCV